MADEFELPKGKRTREIADPVLSKMDDAGLQIEQLSTGKTEVKFGSKNGRSSSGWYSPHKRGPAPAKPRRPRHSKFSSEAEWKDALDDYRLRVADYNERVTIYNQTGGGSKSRLQVTKGEAGSEQNTLAHEIGHRIDVTERPIDPTATDFGNKIANRLVWDSESAIRQAYQNNPGVAFGDIPLASIHESHRPMIELLQAIERSEARSVLASFGETSASAAEYVRYAATPEELWARSFNQWFTKNHGTPEMVADMLAQTTHPLFATSGQITGDQWIGFQWRAAEFDDKIAPLVEKVLRQKGIIE